MPTVTVYQQTNPDGRTYFDGWQYGDEMRAVFTYTDESDASDEMVCERAFHLFNAPEEFLSFSDQPIAAAFRAQRVPSLSIGDVVEVDGRPYACRRMGFEPASGPIAE